MLYTLKFIERNNVRSTKKKHTIALLFTVAVLLILCFQFLKEPSEENIIGAYGRLGVQSMKGYLDNLILTEDAEYRGKVAIEQWRNDEIDPVPVLIFAVIKKISDDRNLLTMYFSDEDADVLGFGLREVFRTDEGHEESIEEICPVFEHLSPPSVWSCFFEVEPRVGRQKNAESRNEYVRDPNAEQRPYIVASVPEPGETDVWIWLYDRAGNQSEPVKVLNSIRDKRQ